MGKYEDELSTILQQGEWAAPNLSSLSIAVSSLERALADLSQPSSGSWSGAAAREAARTFGEMSAQYGEIKRGLAKVSDIIEKANSALADAASDVGDLPSTVVPQDVRNVVAAAHEAGKENVVVNGVTYAVGGAIDAIEGLFGNRREEKAKQAQQLLEERLAGYAEELSVARVEVVAAVPDELSDDDPGDFPGAGDDDSSGSSGSGGAGGSGSGRGGTGGGGTLIGVTPPSVIARPPFVDVWPPSEPPLDPPSLSVDDPLTGVVDLPKPLPPETGLPGLPGVHPGVAPGVVGGGAAAAAVVAARAGGFGVGGVGGFAGGAGAAAPGAVGGSGGLLGGGSASAARGATGATGASGGAGGSAAGGRGGASGGGSASGGTGDERKRAKRAGLGGPVAPKLDDDDEFTPLSEGARAGGRDEGIVD